MNKKADLLKLIPEQGIVPLYYTADADVSIELMRALYAGGIRTTEYADRGEQALANFKQMRRVCDAELPGMYLGIGTIKNVASARVYIDEGAEFLVCPGMIEEVVEVSEDSNLLCIPGCMTPSELVRAEACGRQIVKLFPANSLGPSYIDAVQAVFPDLVFMPTGGIELNENNLRAWFKSGVCAVGGSKMITRNIIDNRLYDELSLQAGTVLNLIHSVREGINN